MVRAPSFDKNGLKKGAWSEEEDEKLRAYIQRYGHWNWRQLPKFAGLSRCGKSCRLRWKNYLQPNVKRGNYSKQEEELILKLHDGLGTKYVNVITPSDKSSTERWSAMGEKLPGRTDNEIKNYWHSHLKKRAELYRKMNLASEKFPETASENVVSDNPSQQSSDKEISVFTQLVSLNIFSAPKVMLKSGLIGALGWAATTAMACDSSGGMRQQHWRAAAG
ncbi:hypothetical protein RJ640_024411 [Escallonia rubra]|uniref:Uncharacterized protein n=1 Tax=Escallonia rubra TaxID=112253 RepID=A0AA88UQK0_9ASTE|nr:hypothetical protein RJ640_024411 [Escallonia rubra]